MKFPIVLRRWAEQRLLSLADLDRQLDLQLGGRPTSSGISVT
ncbi:hypothetical protein LCGC14_2210180, partial [marine sediment metagenome]